MAVKKKNHRPGGPYDRGAADSYYRRSRNPHYYEGGTGTSKRITELTSDQIKEYNTGYDENDNFKVWE
jgi:hypothetical protein